MANSESGLQTTDDDRSQRAQSLESQSSGETGLWNRLEPDPDAFESLKAFKESLTTIPLEELEEDDRKCLFCSKPYGVPSDWQKDDSELPVRLRCNHIFGEKCLHQRYSPNYFEELPLRPLDFHAQSRGNELLGMLHAYAKKQEDYSDHLAVFQQMLQSLNRPSHALALFGPWWGTILEELFSSCSTWSLVNVTFMENAVLLDCGTPGRVHLDPFEHEKDDSGFKQELIGVLAIELANLYSESCKETATVHISSPEGHIGPLPHVCQVRPKIHKGSLEKSKYEVHALDKKLADDYTNVSSSSSERSSDDSHDSIQSEISARLFPAIIRRLCHDSCCQYTPEELEKLLGVSKISPPRKLWWRDIRSMPDTCPVCKKKLFNKYCRRPSQTLSVHGISDNETSGGDGERDGASIKSASS